MHDPIGYRKSWRTLKAIFLTALFICQVNWAIADESKSPATSVGSVLGAKIPFPDDASLPQDKFGLFIGIDTYPGLHGDSPVGCVNDAVDLREIFMTRFGVARAALLTNGHANRAGIGAALRELIQQVKAARTLMSDPITVVITFAGHGSRVSRRSGAGTGGNESTWVASDSTDLADAQGQKDVRASELFQVEATLGALGAQVILISDACHSGTGFRGQIHSRAVVRDRIPTGPTEDLFPELADLAVRRDKAATPSTGFVWYAACGDDASALPTTDEAKRPCGRLSYTMRRVLSETGNKTTYAEVAGRIATVFSATWKDQRPEFHAPPGKELERFFRGGFPPPHATLLGNVSPDGSIELSMGRIHGVSPQSRFTFFDNTDDLERNRRPITSANVISVDELNSKVRVSRDSKIPATAVAAMDAIRLDDFRVGVDGSVPDAVTAKLRELDENKQLTLAASDRAIADVVVHFDKTAGLLGIFSPSALPSPNSPQPKTLRQPIPYASSADAETLATDLLYIARVRRLMNLSRSNSRVIRTEIRDVPAGAATAGQRPPEVNGVPRLVENQRFILHISNGGSQPLFLTILYLKQDGTTEMLYPGAGEAPQSLWTQASIDFPPPGNPFSARIEDVKNRLLGSERTQLKIIATDRYVNFTHLIAVPRTGGNLANQEGSRGADDPLLALMRDALNGGPQTRGPVQLKAPEKWTTDEVTFDVTAAK